MAVLFRQQWLPVPKEEAWSFFSDPKNLNAITPADMHFEIIGQLPDHIYKGMEIDYIIKPFLNIRMPWRTLITDITEGSSFTDMQMNGPYKKWIHHHRFESMNDGTLMTDELEYEIGRSFFGWMAGKLFVHKRVQEIFDFRHFKLRQIYPLNK